MTGFVQFQNIQLYVIQFDSHGSSMDKLYVRIRSYNSNVYNANSGTRFVPNVCISCTMHES